MHGLARVSAMAISGALIVEAHVGWPGWALAALAAWWWALGVPNASGDRLRVPALVGLSLIPYAIASAAMTGVWDAKPEAWAAVAAYLIGTGGLVGLLAAPALRHSAPWARVAGLGAAWALVGGLRGAWSGGFPAVLGATWADLQGPNQALAVIGPWGLDMLIAALSAILAEVAITATTRGLQHTDTQTRLSPKRAIAAMVACIALLSALGAARLATAPALPTVWHDGAPAPPPEHIRATLIQTNVPDWYHRRAWTSPRLQRVLDQHNRALVKRAFDQRPWGDVPDWVVVPESAWGRVFPPEPALLGALRGALPETLPERGTLITALTHAHQTPTPGQPRLLDRALALSVHPSADRGDQLRLLGHATKRQHVPLLEDEYVQGDRWLPVPTPRGDLAPLICYESLFSALAQRAAAPETVRALVVLTNDAVQRHSTGAAWHARLSRARALETGVTMLYTAQSGPSHVADPYGRVVAAQPAWTSGAQTVAFSGERAWAPYRMLGRGVLAVILGVWCAVVWSGRAPRRDRDDAA